MVAPGLMIKKSLSSKVITAPGSIVRVTPDATVMHPWMRYTCVALKVVLVVIGELITVMGLHAGAGHCACA
jgi:hypothetical protein